MVAVRKSPFILILAAVILVWLTLEIVGTLPPVTVPDYTEHRLDRHADIMSPAVSCFSGNGTINQHMYYNPDTGRSAWMCQMDGDMFIWILDKAGETVTMFKNKARCFDQAVKYLSNRGYLP